GKPSICMNQDFRRSDAAVATPTIRVRPGTSSTRSPAVRVIPVVGADRPLTRTHQRFIRHSTVHVSPELAQRLCRRESEGYEKRPSAQSTPRPTITELRGGRRNDHPSGVRKV